MGRKTFRAFHNPTYTQSSASFPLLNQISLLILLLTCYAKSVNSDSSIKIQDSDEMACLNAYIVNYHNAQVELLLACVVCRARWWKSPQKEIGSFLLRHLVQRRMALSTADNYRKDSMRLYKRLCQSEEFRGLLPMGPAKETVSLLVKKLAQIFSPARVTVTQLRKWMRVSELITS